MKDTTIAAFGLNSTSHCK